MRTLFGVVLLLLVGILGVGFYQGWFHLATGSTDHTSSATFTVDQEKIHADEGKAKYTQQKAAEYSQQAIKELPKTLDASVVDQTPATIKPKDVRRDAGPVVERDSDYAKTLKKDFLNKLEAQLDAIDGEIYGLRDKGRKLKDAAKSTWEQKMAELETRKDTARAKLRDLSRANEDTWRDLQYAAQSAYDDLDRAVRDASKE